MQYAREWLRKLPQRLNTSARWLVTKARGTSRSTRISIGVALIVLYWLIPAQAIYIPPPVPEINPKQFGSALILIVGGLYLLEARYRQ